MSKIMTANLLRTGDVVYLGVGDSWVRDIAKAIVATSDNEVASFEAIAERAVEALKVIGPYPMDVDVVDGEARPKSVRETIRAAHGPTV